MNPRIYFVPLICVVIAAGLYDINIHAQKKTEERSFAVEMNGLFLFGFFWNWHDWLTKSETLDFVRIAQQIAHNKPGDKQRIANLIKEYDQKRADSSKLLGPTRNVYDPKLFLNIIEHQNDILNHFFEIQKCSEDLSNYVSDNLSLLQKKNPIAFTQATEFLKREQLSKEKFNQFKATINHLQQQFKEWENAHGKQIVELQSINDAYNRELETYPMYQDLMKMYKTVGWDAAWDKYGDQVWKLQEKLAQKYFGGLDRRDDVAMILIYYSQSVPDCLFAAEWLTKTPGNTHTVDEFGGIPDSFEFIIKSLSDLSQKISMNDKLVSGQ